MTTPITISHVQQMKQAGEKIATLTAYDASFARLLDSAGVDVVLVGDSLGMVLQGESDTLKVSMRDMIYHTRLVRKGLSRALLVADMPYMSYSSAGSAIENAMLLINDAGAEIVKLEGGREVIEVVRALINENIMVCGHLGLQPQSVHAYGGYKVQGRDPESARKILEDARLLEDEGVALLVLECVPVALAETITATLKIPTIGIGAGPECDGQVLVLHDLLGISNRTPQMARNFLASCGSIQEAVAAYVQAVKDRSFPGPENSFT